MTDRTSLLMLPIWYGMTSAPAGPVGTEQGSRIRWWVIRTKEMMSSAAVRTRFVLQYGREKAL